MLIQRPSTKIKKKQFFLFKFPYEKYNFLPKAIIMPY